MSISLGDAIITFNADDSPAVKAFGDLDRLARSTFEQIGQAVKRAGTAFVESQRNVDNHTGAYKEAKEKADRLSAALAAAKDAASKAGDAMGGAGKNVGQLEGELKKSEAALTKAESGMQKAKDKALSFAGGLRDLRSDVKSAEEGFRAAQTRVDSAALALDKAKDSGTATKGEINKLTTEVKSAAREAQAYSEKLEKKRAELKATEDQAGKFNAAVKASSAQLETARANLVTVTAALESARAGAKVTGQSVAELEREVARNNQQLREAEQRLRAAENQMEQTGQAARMVTREYENQTTGLRGLNTHIEQGTQRIRQYYGELMDGARMAGQAVTVASAAILGGIGLAIKSAIDFETAFQGVVKTVDGSAQEIAALRDRLREMSVEMGTSAVELARIAEMAGQLGVKTENIAEFTATIARLEPITNLTSEAAAEMFAQFANITKMDQSNFERLSATVVALGNSGASTEKDIMQLALRMAAAGTVAGMSEYEIVSFAASIADVGIEAEMGGTAFSTMVNRMIAAVRAEQPAEEIEEINAAIEKLTNDHDEGLARLNKNISDIGKRIAETKEDILIEAHEREMDAAIAEARKREQYQQEDQERAYREAIQSARRQKNDQEVGRLERELEGIKTQWRMARDNGSLQSVQLETQLKNERIQRRLEDQQEKLTNLVDIEKEALEERNKYNDEYYTALDKLESKILSNGKMVEKFAKVAGVSADVFKEKFGDDAAGAIGMFLDGVNGLNESGKDLAGTLGELGVEGSREIATITSMALASGKLTETQKLGAKAWEESSAAIIEHAKWMETTQANMGQAKQAFIEIAREIGGIFLPAIVSASQWVLGLAKNIRTWIDEHPGVSKAITLFATGLGLIGAIVGPLLLLLPGIVTAVSLIGGSALVTTGIIIGFLIPVFWWLKDAIASAAVWIGEHWGEISEWVSWGVEVVTTQVKILKEILGIAFSFIGAVLSGFWLAIKDVFFNVVETLGLKTEDIKGFLKSLSWEFQGNFEDVLKNVKNARTWLDEHWDEIAAGIKWFVDTIKGPLETMIEIFKTAFDWGYELFNMLGLVGAQDIVGKVANGQTGALPQQHAEGGWVKRQPREGEMVDIIAGELGPEKAIYPDGSSDILGANGPDVYNVPVGTLIKTASDTAKEDSEFAGAIATKDEDFDSAGATADRRRRFRGLKAAVMERLKAVKDQFQDTNQYHMARRMVQYAAESDGNRRVYDGDKMTGWFSDEETISIPRPNSLYLADRETGVGRDMMRWKFDRIPGFALGGYVGRQPGQASMGGDVNITVNATVREEADIGKISRAVAREVKGVIGGGR